MSRADDDPDDEGLEGLGSFRAMFRDIPDEEPPQRGLAELMAAARIKAEEMAKPSLWERVLQALRRPQVMALATIMILIGGAVFISQRQSEMDASPTATQLEENAAPAQTIATGAAGSASPGAESQDRMTAEEGAVGGATPEPAADPKRDDERGANLDLDAKSAPATAADDASAEANKKEASRAPARKAAPKAPPMTSTTSPTKSVAKPKQSMPSGPSGKKAGGDLLFEGDLDGATAGGGGSTSGAPAPTAAAPEAEKPVAAPTPPSQNTPPALTVQQLHANARKLAAAGDCAQVRTVAKQIAAKDAKYYRDHIATDSSLATCLK